MGGTDKFRLSVFRSTWEARARILRQSPFYRWHGQALLVRGSRFNRPAFVL